MKRVSIIIPIYNMENYIERSLKSIINQLNEKEDEVVIIDDGSTDNSFEICKKYVEKYSNIKIKRVKNQGPSAARNLGIEISTGKYIIFVDVDDYIEDGYINNLLKYINKYPLVICGYNIIKENRKISIRYNGKDEILRKEKVIILYEKNLLNTLWNKIYISKIIKENNIKFDNKLYKGEDLLFNLDYIYYMNGDIYTISKELYNYEMKTTGLNLGAGEELETKIYRSNKIYDGLIAISPNENKRIALNIIEMYRAHIKYYIIHESIINPIKVNEILRKSTLNDKFKKIINDDYNSDKQMKALNKKYKTGRIVRMFQLNRKFLKVNKKEK